MAKKAELLEQAKKLKLEVSSKNTIAEIEAAIKAAGTEEGVEKGEPEVKAVAEAVVTEEEPKTAKAGKRSAKALKEAEELAAKEERKASSETAEDKPKVIKNPARTKLERAGKKLREAAKLIEKDKQYSLKEAVDLATKTSTTKFDSTVELHINLNVDPKHADQNLRDNLVLPNGTGKTVRVAVIAEADDVAAAKKAGADKAGLEDLMTEIEKGKLDFDVLIATPAMMPKLGKLARVLGPKGLMPNPKSGTVTTEVAKAVEQAKAGRVEYRVDSTGIVHLGVGKVSFGTDKLEANIQTVFASIKQNKPASVKSNYVKNITVTTSMGPGIKVAPSEL